MPYAIHWQVKQSVWGKDGLVPTDYRRLVSIIKKGGYKGYLPIETLPVRGKPYDPFTLVPEMLSELEKAIREVYR